jgi:hypothetical protein
MRRVTPAAPSTTSCTTTSWSTPSTICSRRLRPTPPPLALHQSRKQLSKDGSLFPGQRARVSNNNSCPMRLSSSRKSKGFHRDHRRRGERRALLSAGSISSAGTCLRRSSAHSCSDRSSPFMYGSSYSISKRSGVAVFTRRHEPFLAFFPFLFRL